MTLSGNGGELRAGESHTFNCQVTGGEIGATTYQWFRNGSVLSGQTAATLSIPALSETDSGVYRCQGTKGFMTMASTSVSINVVGEYYRVALL